MKQLLFQKLFFKTNHYDSNNKDKYDIDTEVMARHYTSDEIMDIIQEVMNEKIQQRFQTNDRNKADNHEKKVISCLNALAFKIDSFNKQQRTNKTITNDEREMNDGEQMMTYQISQEASYTILQLYPSNDEVISASYSLLAMVANSSILRERHLKMKENCDISIPINIMKSSLDRTKSYVPNVSVHNRDSYDDDEEQMAAELQRKGCIYLGALSDGSSEIATHIVQCGGLERILDSIDWFRYHIHVINWALWSIFNICFDNVYNKGEFIRCNGIEIVCRVMKNVLCCEDVKDTTLKEDDNEQELLEVARHGSAILFDLLRIDTASVQGNHEKTTLNIIQTRNIALNAGLHEVLLLSMEKFQSDTQIISMGNEILIATGFKGVIPSVQGSILCKSHDLKLDQ